MRINPAFRPSNNLKFGMVHHLSKRQAQALDERISKREIVTYQDIGEHLKKVTGDDGFTWVMSWYRLSSKDLPPGTIDDGEMLAFTNTERFDADDFDRLAEPGLSDDAYKLKVREFRAKAIENGTFRYWA